MRITKMLKKQLYFLLGRKESLIMAMIDYGAIAWKDGKLISTDMFTPMEDMVGWSDEDKSEVLCTDLSSVLAGNYFAYIGDKDFTVCFYKNIMHIYCPDEYYNEELYFSNTPFRGWRYWRKWYFIDFIGEEAEIIVRPRRFHDYYICTMKYRGHKYKVAFGYGVDLKYYKETHIIDYYGTPWFRAKSWLRDIHYKIEDWKRSKGL